jgi:hypothetical protein
VLVPSVALLAAGTAVAAGLVAGDQPDASAALSAELSTARQVDPGTRARLDAERTSTVSRSSDRRSAVDRAVDPAKAQLLNQKAQSGGQVTRTKNLAAGDPRSIARAMLAEFGFSSDQFSCLDALWTKESGWNVYADNSSSSAYGIPQALPGSKMSTAGADWATNPATQIRWGLGYIQGSYGSPCGAWSHSESYNWY